VNHDVFPEASFFISKRTAMYPEHHQVALGTSAVLRVTFVGLQSTEKQVYWGSWCDIVLFYFVFD